jgi:transcriptional regulator NrdR family protein
MVCIYCRNSTRVTNSRHQKRLNQVWRRRTCLTCGSTFTSHEAISLGDGVLVHNGATSSHLQPFSRSKLLISIYESCKHRTKALEDAEGLTETIISRLMQQHLQKATLDRSSIIHVTADVLQHFDSIAATMYKAYHSAK